MGVHDGAELVFMMRQNMQLSGLRVIRALDQIVEWQEKPSAIRCDTGIPMKGPNLLETLYRLNMVGS